MIWKGVLADCQMMIVGKEKKKMTTCMYLSKSWEEGADTSEKEGKEG